MACCYTCIHPMVAANGKRICRADPNSLKLSPAVERDCKRYVPKEGQSHEIPSWYWVKKIGKRPSSNHKEHAIAGQV